MFQFLTATIDCVVFLSLRAWRNAKDADKEEFLSITTDEVTRIWVDGVLPETGKLTRMDRSMFAEQRLESTREAAALSKGLSRLAQEASGEQRWVVDVSSTANDCFGSGRSTQRRGY